MSNNRLRVASVDCLPPHMRAAALAQLNQHVAHPAPARVVVGGHQPKRSEHQEQADFVRALVELAQRDPRYARAVRRTYAIPNGGGRTKRQAAELREEGVRPGVPDIFVSYPVGALKGLYLELKSLTGDPSREQREWLNESVDLGYAAACCRGAREAMTVWLAYVDPSL